MAGQLFAGDRARAARYLKDQQGALILAEGRLIAMSDGGGASVLLRDGDGHPYTVQATVGGGAPTRLVARHALRASGEAELQQLGNNVYLWRSFDSSGAMTGVADSAWPR